MVHLEKAKNNPQAILSCTNSEMENWRVQDVDLVLWGPDYTNSYWSNGLTNIMFCQPHLLIYICSSFFPIGIFVFLLLFLKRLYNLMRLGGTICMFYKNEFTVFNLPLF